MYLVFFTYYYLDVYTRVSVQTTIQCNLASICISISYNSTYEGCAVLPPGPEWIDTFPWVCG